MSPDVRVALAWGLCLVSGTLAALALPRWYAIIVAAGALALAAILFVHARRRS
jgi:hypothetical protein